MNRRNCNVRAGTSSHVTTMCRCMDQLIVGMLHHKWLAQANLVVQGSGTFYQMRFLQSIVHVSLNVTVWG